MLTLIFSEKCFHSGEACNIFNNSFVIIEYVQKHVKQMETSRSPRSGNISIELMTYRGTKIFKRD